MAGSIFNRVKTWLTSEDVNASDLNAEFNNILNNLDTEGLGGYGDNTTEFQAQTDPGEVGSESLPSSLADELERLRYSIAELKGTTYWYTSPVTTLASLNTAFGNGGLPPSRLSSGATTGNSNQSLLITPEGVGVGDGFTIKGTPTTLTYYVDGTEYTLTSNVTVAATNAAPATNNTCLVNDAGYSGQSWTKYLGMVGTAIPIDNVGSEITSLNGKLAAFQLTNTGTETEYFIAKVDTDNSQLVDCKRGWFFDESGAAIPAVTLSDNDTLTLMSLVWVFLKNDNTADITYNEPIVSPTQPSSPSSGDYWYDQTNETWKKFNGSSYDSAAAVFVGNVITNSSDECVGARSDDFVKSFLNYNNAEVTFTSNTTLSTQRDTRVGVYGSVVTTRNDDIVWDITTDLDTGTESTSTLYFFYVTESGTPKISIQAPIDFSSSRGGFYHPHETWRCLGQAWNNASGNLDHVISYHSATGHEVAGRSTVSGNALTLDFWASPLLKFKLVDNTTATQINYKSTQFPFHKSVTVPSGATLSWTDTSTVSAGYAYDQVVLHLVKKNSIVELGVSAHQHGGYGLVSTTALGTASDSTLLYSASAYTSANVVAVGYGRGELATAGTWASNLDYFKVGPGIQVYRKRFSANIGAGGTLANGSDTTVASVPFYTTGTKKVLAKLYVPKTAPSTSTGVVTMDTGTNVNVTCSVAIANSVDNELSTHTGSVTFDGGSGTLELPGSYIGIFDPENLTVGHADWYAEGQFFPAGRSATVRGRLVVMEIPDNEISGGYF